MSASRLLRERFALALLAPMGLCAFISGHGVGELAVARLGPGERELALGAAPRARAHAAPFHATRADAILARNPFDSRWAPVTEAEAPREEDLAADPDDVPACDDLKVLAIVSSEDVDWSFAALQSGADRPVLRRRGGEVAHGEVVFVGRERVWMRRSDHLCQAWMFAPQATTTTAVDAGVHTGPLPGVGPLEASLTRRIQRVGPTDFNVDRSVVEQVLENQAELLGRTHIALELDKQSGRNAGVRLSGIQAGGLLSTLGIENGDRLQTINGFDVTNPTSALEAFARLQQAPRLDVVVNRRGAPMTLDYTIR